MANHAMHEGDCQICSAEGPPKSECGLCMVKGQPKRKWTCPCGYGYWDAVHQVFVPGSKVRSKDARSRADYEAHLQSCRQCNAKAEQDDLTCPTKGPPWTDKDYGPNAQPHVVRLCSHGTRIPGSRDLQDPGGMHTSPNIQYSSATQDQQTMVQRRTSEESRYTRNSRRTVDPRTADPRTADPRTWDTRDMRTALDDQFTTDSGTWQRSLEHDRRFTTEIQEKQQLVIEESRSPYQASWNNPQTQLLQPSISQPLFPRKAGPDPEADQYGVGGRHQSPPPRHMSALQRQSSADIARDSTGYRQVSRHERSDSRQIIQDEPVDEEDLDSTRRENRHGAPRSKTEGRDLRIDQRTPAYGPRAKVQPGANPLVRPYSTSARNYDPITQPISQVIYSSTDSRRDSSNDISTPVFDPRADPSIDPRIDKGTDSRHDAKHDSRQDPRGDPTGDPRYDPRTNPRDPRGDPRNDTRINPRDPRGDPRNDPRTNPKDQRESHSRDDIGRNRHISPSSQHAPVESQQAERPGRHAPAQSWQADASSRPLEGSMRRPSIQAREIGSPVQYNSRESAYADSPKTESRETDTRAEFSSVPDESIMPATVARRPTAPQVRRGSHATRTREEVRGELAQQMRDAGRNHVDARDFDRMVEERMEAYRRSSKDRRGN